MYNQPDKPVTVPLKGIWRKRTKRRMREQ